MRARGREIGPRGGPRLHEGEASRWLAFIALRKHSLKTHRTLLWDSDYAPKREGETRAPASTCPPRRMLGTYVFQNLMHAYIEYPSTWVHGKMKNNWHWHHSVCPDWQYIKATRVSFFVNVIKAYWVMNMVIYVDKIHRPLLLDRKLFVNTTLQGRNHWCLLLSGFW